MKRLYLYRQDHDRPRTLIGSMIQITDDTMVSSEYVLTSLPSIYLLSEKQDGSGGRRILAFCPISVGLTMPPYLARVIQE